MTTTSPANRTFPLLAGESEDVREDLRPLFASDADFELWLQTPNSNFLLKTPGSLIGTPDERMIRDWLGTLLYIGIS